MKRSGELFPLAALRSASNAAVTAQSRRADRTHGGKKELKNVEKKLALEKSEGNGIFRGISFLEIQSCIQL